MSSLVETVIEFVVDVVIDSVSDWVTTRWPWVGQAFGAVCLVVGVAVGLSSTGDDRIHALVVCAGALLILVTVLVVRFCRRRRAMAAAVE
jgi:hypothetical protein